ncbi:MAG TPA: uroporphyrinogen-III C-methyltransferase [Spirochaetes bacterium]|nr:uroporphyrinogen-III C-methyltransferase [Spirochaetota bacterium]
MEHLLIGISETERDQTNDIHRFLNHHLPHIQWDFKSFNDIVPEKINHLLTDAEIDLFVCSYQRIVPQSTQDKTCLTTTLPKLKDIVQIEDPSKEVIESPFGKYKYALKFLKNRTDLIDLFSPYFGKVWLIGAGAGNKELITVKGRKRVSEADVVISDYLLDQDILKSYTGEHTLIVPLTKYGKRIKKNHVSQGNINETILRYALLEKKVVRLKGGDPFVFGRGGEECEYLLPYGIDYEVIPGISAMLSALSYAGIPLTHRDYNAGFIVITGYRRECEESHECYQRIARKINFALEADLVAILFMSLSNWNHFAQLITYQEAPVAFIESGAYPRQRVFLSEVHKAQSLIEKEDFKSPTLIVVGENVQVRNHLKWFEHLPLYGMRILVFASEKLSVETSDLLNDLGADCRGYELYDLVPERIDQVSPYLKGLSNYDYIVITSRNAIDILLSDLKALNIDIRTLPKIIVTGKKTEGEFRKLGIIPDIVPNSFSTDGIIDSLSQLDIKGKRFLFPKSSLTKGVLSSYIREMEGIVDDFILYKNVPKKLSEITQQDILDFKAHYIIFTSSSSVEYYFKSLYDLNHRFIPVSIGSKTSQALRDRGIEDVMEAKSFTTNGIKDLFLRDIAKSPMVH